MWEKLGSNSNTKTKDMKDDRSVKLDGKTTDCLKWSPLIFSCIYADSKLAKLAKIEAVC